MDKKIGAVTTLLFLLLLVFFIFTEYFSVNIAKKDNSPFQLRFEMTDTKTNKSFMRSFTFLDIKKSDITNENLIVKDEPITDAKAPLPPVGSAPVPGAEQPLAGSAHEAVPAPLPEPEGK